MDAIKRYFRSPAAVIGLMLLLVVIAMAISAGWLYPRDPLALAGRPLIWPFANPRFLLGTDNSGRDIAAQIFYGARISLLIGGVATAIADHDRHPDRRLRRLLWRLGRQRADADHRGVPDAAEFRAAPGAGRGVRLDPDHGHHRGRRGVVAGAGAADPRRVPVAAQPRIRAGRPDARHADIQLILGEILPNALPPVIVYASVVMAVAILLESALAFLRLSDPNVASWGNLIGLGRDVLRVQWYVSAIPGIAILVTVLAVSLVGQGLNDALNPRLKGR